MSRRGDNIHKRKDGRWEGRYKNGYKMDGTAKYSSVYAGSYSECKQKLIKAQLNTEKVIRTSEKLFSDILYDWLNTNKVRIKGATEAKYIQLIETHIAPEIGGLKIKQINSGIVNDLLNSKMKSGGIKGKESLSASYVRTMAIIIESAIKYAVKEELCEPLKTPIFKPPISKKEIVILSEDIEYSLTQKLYTNMSPVAIGILLALQCGLRIGEVCALKWSDIDFDKGLIHIKHTVSRVPCLDGKHRTKLVLDVPKTSSSIRSIPIPSHLRSVLMDAYKYKKSDFVVSTKSDFVGTRTFDAKYRKLLKKYGLSVFSFHTLRHTYATRCADSGMNAKMLSQLLGHSSSNFSLNIYVHPSIDLAMSLIDNIYASA